jgi:nitrous oxidase accessory protein NosD
LITTPTRPATNVRTRRRGRWLFLVAIGLVAVFAGLIALRSQGGADAERAVSGPMVIDGEEDLTIDSVHITSTEGDCLIIRNSKRITLTNSEIGPCKGRGVLVHDSSEVQILDSYIHPEFKVTGCCDKGDGVFAYTSSKLLIQGNVIAYGESNIEMLGVSDAKVIGNFLLNPLGPHPRGQHVQVWSQGAARSKDILIEKNYALSSQNERYKMKDDQHDAINVGFTDGATVRENYVEGGRSESGCALLVDSSANSVQLLSNTLIDNGQCGIGIGSGTNHVVDGNRIYGDGIDKPKAGNTALYVWKQYAGACGPVRISNNTAVLKRPNGTLSSYWDGGGCGPVTLTNNTFDKAALDALSTVKEKFPPPPIPPLMHTKRAATPYSE